MKPRNNKNVWCYFLDDFSNRGHRKMLAVYPGRMDERKKIKRWRSMMSRPGGCVENLLPAYTGRRWGAWGTLCPAQATTPDSLNHAFLGRLVISRGKVNIMTLRSRQHPTGWILYKCCCLVICSYLFSEQLVRYLLVYSRLTYNPNSCKTEYTN